ncbi:MAG: hypothetical protein NTY77_18780 [Elusimicrobia bacterium]|nr:hypothetical protein [Elusimicrobiota bacterium]
MHPLLAALLLCLPLTAHAGLPAVDWERLLSGWSARHTAAPSAPATVPAQAVMRLRGLLSVWTQDCAPDCGLPSAIVKNDPVLLELPLPEKPGQFRAVRLKREYQVSGGTLQVQADFYALYPPGAAPYFSVQVELSGAAAALCTASLNEADFSPFPVLACGSPRDGKRLGLTLHRAPL